MIGRFVAFIFACTFYFTEVSAQNDTTNLDYMFDDGGISTSKILLKTDVLAMVHGDWPLIMEYVASNTIGLEVGIGVLMPYYIHEFLPLIFTDNKGIINNSFGHSIQLQVKWYGLNQAPELHYWGIHYYRKAYSDIIISEFTFTMGKQRILGKRFLFDISLGLGVRTQNSEGAQYMFDPDFSLMPILPLHIRFGYITH